MFFGTDGIRGRVLGEQHKCRRIINEHSHNILSTNIAFVCGNSLAKKYPNAKVIIGKDTRKSGDLILSLVAAGIVAAGGSVISVGECPTAGISYLVKSCGYDFGIVISASHNPAEYNGIKIFDSTGKKLSKKQERELEAEFTSSTVFRFDKLGEFSENKALIKKYEKFLKSSILNRLDDLKIVLDTASGAAYKIAPKVFKNLGAEVVVINSKPNGININQNCGATNLTALAKKVKSCNADIGFAFDGDSDRVIMVNERGEVLDGDTVLFAFAKDYLEKGRLNPKTVVGTKMTNMGMELALNACGISLERVNVGDKYVSEKIEKDGLLLGGEASGHIIVRDKLVTGDGILNALLLAEIYKKQGDNFMDFCHFDAYAQVMLNVSVKNKDKVMNNKLLKAVVFETENSLLGVGRVLVRPSGTEQCVRVMVETKNSELSNALAEKIKAAIVKIVEE